MPERAWTATAVGAAIGLAGLVFVGRLLVLEWPAVERALGEAEPAWLLVALLCGLCGMTGIGATWQVIIRSLGGELAWAVALRAYFVGQLGKYLPGGIWGVVGRGEWARREGVASITAYSSVVLSMVTAYLAASMVALVIVVLRPEAVPSRGLAVAVGLLGPAGLVLLHPAVAKTALRFIEGLVKRPNVLRIPAWSASWDFVRRQAPSWLFIGTATWATSKGLGVSAELDSILLATCVSWVSGFLIIPVPGGLGVREAIFVAVLEGEGELAAVALCARMVFVLVDLIGAGASSLWHLVAARGEP